MNEKPAQLIVFAAWLTATVATLGSLFFSEVMGFVPCTLCWYQRVFMYPLVLIFLAAALKYEPHFFRYSVPLIAGGWLSSLYHNLLQLEIIPENASPCVQGIPCTLKYINWLGFISIPVLSFTAFSILAALMYIFYRRHYHE